MRRLISALTLMAFAAASAPAWADGDAEREADAERLFREAQGLLEKGVYAEACPKFQQAYEKDGKLGTLINLAFCHKAQGANWYAWLEFREAEVKAADMGRNDRRDYAKKERVALEKGLPKVVIDNPQKVPLSEIKIDDHKLPDMERTTAEPGQRKFVFKAKGKKAATLLVQVTKEAKAQHVAVPTMEDGSDDPPPPPTTTQASTTPDPPTKPDKVTDPVQAEDTGKTQRTLGVVGMGVGAVALGVGGVFGIMVLGSKCNGTKQNDNKDGNQQPICTTDELNRDHSRATVSTVVMITGGVLAATGLTLFLTAPSAPRSTGIVVRPQLGLGYAGVAGTF